MSQNGQGEGQLPTQPWRPTKRRAFLGQYAPAFYDEANTHQVQGQERPNAVLENAVGLMLCYDELWFAHRTQCPADMQQLDFVRFVEDDATMMRTAAEAYEQCQEALPVPQGLLEDPHRVTEPIATNPLKYHPIAKMSASMRQLEHRPFWKWVETNWVECRREHDRQERQFQHLKEHVTGAMEAAGHRCALVPNTPYGDIKGDFFRRLRLDFLQVAEWTVADALQLGPMDCIVNSGSVVRLDLPQEGGPGFDAEFESHKIEAIERVLHLRSTELLSPRGAYHEYIADLRKDKRVKELREFLAGRPSPDGTAAALIDEVEQVIAAYKDDAFDRAHRKTMLRTVASMSLSFGANQILPGLGVLGATVNADRVVSDFKFKKATRWAKFVVDARKQWKRREEEG